MKYKYQKGQLFGKRLPVPKNILYKVYSQTLSFVEYLQYDLEDKVPLTCLDSTDRKIVEKFGLRRAKALDWHALNRTNYYLNRNPKDILLSLDTETEDLNLALYELLKDELRPCDYSPRMKQIYPERILSVTGDDSENLVMHFNDGELDLEELIDHWDLVKDKDLSFCLLKDRRNSHHITDAQVKNFMENYQNISRLVCEVRNIYDFIYELSQFEEEEEKKAYLKDFANEALLRSHSRPGDYRIPIPILEEEYEVLFQYTSIEEYLSAHCDVSDYVLRPLLEELKTLPEGYIFHLPFPFSVFEDWRVVEFVSIYGLKNVVDFDNECGHFFSKNDCEMLKNMYEMYLHYAGNEHDPAKTFFTKKTTDENGNYVDRPYTKDEFYEAMKRMVLHGPCNWDFADKAPDYRQMTGEFRRRNTDLFLSEEAPEELKTLFYTKAITPTLMREHPEYVPFLEGRNLESCFKDCSVRVDGAEYLGFKNLYTFLGSKVGYPELMDFLIENEPIINLLFYQREMAFDYYNFQVDIDDDIKTIQKKFYEAAYKKLLEKNLAFSEDYPKDFKELYPDAFLEENAPEELKTFYYQRKIDIPFIKSHPEYIPALRKIHLGFIYPKMEIAVQEREYNPYETRSLPVYLKERCGDEAFDMMIEYGPFIVPLHSDDRLTHCHFKDQSTKEEILHDFDEEIYHGIIDGKVDSYEEAPEHFQESHPTLFLSKEIDSKIRKKFYNREFSLQEINDHPEIVEFLGEANIICGFPVEYAWMIPLFEDEKDSKIANYNRLKVVAAYSKIEDVALRSAFKDYITDYGDKIDLEKIDYVTGVLQGLANSNSTEIFNFRKELATLILQSDNPMDSLKKIEDVFIHNNIPTVGKIYSCFEILHPNFKGFDMHNTRISPTLKDSSNLRRKVIVFSDLIKASFGSNNRSVISYLENIEIGTILYERILRGEKVKDLSIEEQDTIRTFYHHLVTLYNNTLKGKKDKKFVPTGNIEEDFIRLRELFSPDGSLDYSMGDRLVKMFCGFAGIETLQEAKKYIYSKTAMADARNRSAAKSDMVLERGDFVKGIGGVGFLRNILQNGSVSKEFLGSSATSDSTPLDTDVSMILLEDGTTAQKMGATAAAGYGPIWFVLKHDDRFQISRTHDHEVTYERDLSKLEAFYTGVCGEGHYGIRTGFASSEINYIVVEKMDKRIGLEIALNGFYIPVYDHTGKILFTPEEYDTLRAKMSGLSYYGEKSYQFSSSLITPEVLEIASQIEESNREVKEKREMINQMIQEALEEVGLTLKTKIDGDLTRGVVELIDTGSTGRGTNKPGDGDFDFMMRLDRTLLSNPQKLDLFKKALLRRFGKDNSEVISTGDFRLKGVCLDNHIKVDIDITFVEKTDKVAYSTDMALQDRLKTIEKTDSLKHKYVLANILLAKRVLKEAHVYKPFRGENPEGGLGGVGIENWILQHGGSFLEAAKSFVEAAKDCSFDEFKQKYVIWDFGENHLAEKKGLYPHDNFVYNNMSEEGYHKMVECLLAYIKKVETTYDYEEQNKR